MYTYVPAQAAFWRVGRAAATRAAGRPPPSPTPTALQQTASAFGESAHTRKCKTERVSG